MAVVVMKRMGIYALKADRKKILERLQMENVIEVQTEKDSSEVFSKTDTSSAVQTFDRNIKLLDNAVEILDEYVESPKGLPAMFAGRKPISGSDFNKIEQRSQEVVKLASQLNKLQKEILENQSELLRLEGQIDSLLPWVNLDVSMRVSKTKSTKVFIGTFPNQISELEIKELLAHADVNGSELEIISEDEQQTCVFIVCSMEDGDRAEQALRAAGFAYPPSPSKIPPKQRLKELEQQMQVCRENISAAESEIKTFAQNRTDFLYTSDYFTARAEKYKVLGELWQSPHVFSLTGFVPEKKAQSLKNLLENKFGAFVEISDPLETDDVPVKLKNNLYSEPVEGVIAGYSLPQKGEIDPSSIMAIFYYVLFGMMLSDAGYGLIMVIACSIILAKCKNMEESMKGTFRMFLYCGITTVFWGAMFGSFFGDAVTVIAKTFFNRDMAIPALWFSPLDDPMRLLVFSLAFGVVHIFTGLAAGLYQFLKSKSYKDALYDVVFWYLLVGGLIVALLSTQMFAEMVNLSFILPQAVGNVALIIAGIAAIAIVATSGRESRSPYKRLLKGIYGLYNISGYLSDILSYSRLLALGLATGVIATVFNQMAAMVAGDGGVVGVILFSLVFIVGHVINLAINALGAYVHTNRLQYVEFFGKFYEGGGKPFKPFAGNTKYIKVTEEK